MDSTSNSENKVGWGTTILSHIYGDTIYMVSDGRQCSSSTAEGILLVTKGNDKKIYRVSDRICATTAGNVALCEEMLEITWKEAENLEDVSKMTTKLKKHVEKCLSDMRKEMGRNKKNKRVKPDFRAHFGLNSVDGWNRRPHIELIGFRDHASDEDRVIVGSGTGGEAAATHFTELVTEREPRTALERLSYMKQSVVASGLDDPYTGGFIQEAILSPNGLTIAVQKNHIIKHLADNHQHFVHILSTKLLCITRDFAYKLENEEMMAKLIKKNFPGVLKPKELLLGVHARLIVRCLVFLDQATANRAFDSIRVRGGEHVLPLRLNSGAVHQVEIKRPTRDEFIVLARDFKDESDL